MNRPRSKSAILTTILAIGGLSAASTDAGTMHAVSGSGGTASSLYTVNLVTGVATLVGPLGKDHVTGLDFHPTTGVLYGNSSGTFAPDIGQLLTVNTTTGAATAVGVTPHNCQVPDISFRADGTLFAWGEVCLGLPVSDDLMTINLTTGAATQIGGTVGTFQTGLAFDNGGILWLKSGSSLFNINPATGATTAGPFPMTGDCAAGADNGLEVDPDTGIAYTFDRVAGNTFFCSLNLTTKVATRIGLMGAANIAALASKPGAVTPPTTCDLTLIESKLDDDLRWVDEGELSTSQTTQTTTLVTEINQNETKINALEAKLDDDLRWVDEGELSTSQATQTTTLTTEINQNETKINALEAKLDDDLRWVDEGELSTSQTTQTTTLVTEIDENQAILEDAKSEIMLIESKLDELAGIDEALCTLIDLLLTPEKERCSDTAACGFGAWPSGLDSVPTPATCVVPKSASVGHPKGSGLVPLGDSVARAGGRTTELLRAAQSTDLAVALPIGQTQVLRAFIATALRSDEVEPLLLLPEAEGGLFEELGRFVGDLAEHYRGLRNVRAESTFVVEDALTEARRLVAEGDNTAAYVRYRDVYRSLRQAPQQR